MRARARHLSVALTTVLMVAAVAVGSADGATSLVLRFDFDRGESLASGSRVVDSSGAARHGTIRTQAGGALTATTSQDGSRAVKYPRRCSDTTCPKAVIAVPDYGLDPGTRTLTFGARVRLTSDLTSKGSNILQKGLWGDPGGQWKLQVDGYAGRPSCVVSGYAAGRMYRVTVVSGRSVSDGGWHAVSCRRTPSEVAIYVDGRVEGRKSMPLVNLSSTAQVLVGGKSVSGQSNDQYFGSLDDVYVRFD